MNSKVIQHQPSSYTTGTFGDVAGTMPIPHGMALDPRSIRKLQYQFSLYHYRLTDSRSELYNLPFALKASLAMAHADLVIICSGLTLITVPPDVDIGHSSAISWTLSTQDHTKWPWFLDFGLP